MNFIRNHWYHIGVGLGIIIVALIGIVHPALSHYQLLMWLSLVSLCFHQFEEYVFPGTFPGMINKVMFASKNPGSYPLNTNTAFLINVPLGWGIYLLAALAGEHFVWLGMAAILISLGNFIAHTFVFNIKGKTFYNAGMGTSWLFFAPCVFFFFRIVNGESLATTTDYIIGIPLGIIINFFGVFKLIGWLLDKNTTFIFKKNQLLPGDRK